MHRFTMHIRLFTLLAVVSASGIAGPVGYADEQVNEAVHVIRAGEVQGADPVLEGATSEVDEGHLLLTLSGGTSWARVSFRGVPKDIRRFQHLALLGRGDGAKDDLYIRIRDAANRVASLRVGVLESKSVRRELALGDFQPESGFDPAQVSSIALVWFEPKAASVRVADLTFVPGKGGWRHDTKEQLKKIFGARRARSVKSVEAEYFDAWTDSSSAKRSLGKSLATALDLAMRRLGVDKHELAQFRVPVYVFKSAKHYRAYCEREFGWSKEAAARSTAFSSYWMILMQQQGKRISETARHVGQVLLQHTRGVGGGAWLRDGVGELCYQEAEQQDIHQQVAPRVKSSKVWPMASLLAADSLTLQSKRATYDNQLTRAHAASVVAYLLETPTAFKASDLPAAGSERVTEGLKRLAAVRSTGRKRLAAFEKVLGPIAELDAAWRAFVTAKR